jgi:hypothetical protein
MAPKAWANARCGYRRGGCILAPEDLGWSGAREDRMQAQIRQERDAWMLRVDGAIRGEFRAWTPEDAKAEASRRLGFSVEWESRGDLEYVAVILDHGEVDWR